MLVRYVHPVYSNVYNASDPETAEAIVHAARLVLACQVRYRIGIHLYASARTATW